MAKISAKIGKDGTPVEVEYPLLDATTVADLIKNFGEDVVVAHAKSSITVAAQGLMRGMQKAGKSAKDIQEAMAKWKPGLRTPGKSKMEKAADLVSSMSPEERKELLKKLQGK